MYVHAVGVDRPLPARCRDAVVRHDGQLPRCGDGGRIPAGERPPPHRLYSGYASFDARAGPRARIRRYAACSRAGRSDRGDGRGFFRTKRLSGDQTGAGPGRAAYGDLRAEQPDPARGGEGGPRIGPADSRRYFCRFVRRQHAFQLPRSGDHLHRPADGRDRHAGREAAHSRRPRARRGAFAPAPAAVADHPPLGAQPAAVRKRKAHRIYPGYCLIRVCLMPEPACRIFQDQFIFGQFNIK